MSKLQNRSIILVVVLIWAIELAGALVMHLTGRELIVFENQIVSVICGLFSAIFWLQASPIQSVESTSARNTAAGSLSGIGVTFGFSAINFPDSGILQTIACVGSAIVGLGFLQVLAFNAHRALRLQAVLEPKEVPAVRHLYDRVRARFAPLGDVDLDLPPREPTRESPRFD